jgi:hypothetical protein
MANRARPITVVGVSLPAGANTTKPAATKTNTAARQYSASLSKTVTQLKPLEKLSATERRMIESITYTESGKPNIKLVSKEFAHRELRGMLGGDAQPGERVNDFSNYSDAELLAELGRLADELGIKMTLTIPTDEKCDCVLDTLLPARS